MSAMEIYRTCARQILRPIMRAHGFKQRGLTFRRDLGEVIQLLSLQKSRSSSKAEVKFAVNLGVSSSRILQRAGAELASSTIEECQWRTRARLDGTDKWWRIVDHETGETAFKEVQKWVEDDGLKMLSVLQSDNGLVALWRSGRSPGLTEDQRLAYLSVLSEAMGLEKLSQEVAIQMVNRLRASDRPILRHRLRELESK